MLRLDKPKSWLERATYMKAEFRFEPCTFGINQFELKPFKFEPLPIKDKLVSQRE